MLGDAGAPPSLPRSMSLHISRSPPQVVPPGAKTAGDMMRDLLRNKTIAFIGDSINNLVFRAFLCEIAKEDYITYPVRTLSARIKLGLLCPGFHTGCPPPLSPGNASSPGAAVLKSSGTVSANGDFRERAADGSTLSVVSHPPQ